MWTAASQTSRALAGQIAFLRHLKKPSPESPVVYQGYGDGQTSAICETQESHWASVNNPPLVLKRQSIGGLENAQIPRSSKGKTSAKLLKLFTLRVVADPKKEHWAPGSSARAANSAVDQQGQGT